MQLAIELPDDLCQEVLRHGNVQLFVKQALEKKLLEEKRINHMEQSLMATVPKSVSLVDELIADRRLEAKKEPLGMTQSLIGALQNTESLSIEEDNTLEILEIMRKIKPVKCEYRSEQIVRSLRDGTVLE